MLMNIHGSTIPELQMRFPNIEQDRSPQLGGLIFGNIAQSTLIGMQGLIEDVVVVMRISGKAKIPYNFLGQSFLLLFNHF